MEAGPVDRPASLTIQRTTVPMNLLRLTPATQPAASRTFGVARAQGSHSIAGPPAERDDIAAQTNRQSLLGDRTTSTPWLDFVHSGELCLPGRGLPHKRRELIPVVGAERDEG